MTTEPTQYIGPTADDVREFYTNIYAAMTDEQAAYLTGIWLKGQIDAAQQRANAAAARRLFNATGVRRIKEARGDE